MLAIFKLRCPSQCTVQKALNFYSQYAFMHTSRRPKNRGNFSKITNKDLSHFENILGKSNVITDDLVVPYNTDWLKQWKGASEIVLRPHTTDQVSEILKYINQHNIAICPQGGNTGLVGGSVPVFDEIIMSMSRMNRVIEVEADAGFAVCQSGCVLEHLDHIVSEHGLMVPLDLGSRGTCQIGGNVSTNAGGLRLLRYGSLHENVLGLRVVLPNGDILDCLNTLRKNNTGYNMKHLFIGSEGTLGIVTEVALLCPIRPLSVNVAFLGVKDFANVLQTFRIAKKKLGEVLSAFEFMDWKCVELVETNLKIRNPLESFPFYVLVETQGSNESHDEEKMQNFLQQILNDGVVADGVHSSQPSQIKDIWELRERITEAIKINCHVYKYDISLPLRCYYDIVPELRTRMGSSITACVGYGHLGDGNLHLNLCAPTFEQRTYDLLIPYLFEWIAARKGSVSAEHGLGQEKKNYSRYSKSERALGLMSSLKRHMDPKGILNPYKVFADSETYY